MLAKLVPEKGVKLLGEGKGVIDLAFNLNTRVDYFLTQSNIEEADRQVKKYADIVSNLETQLLDFDLSGKFNYGYTYEISRFSGS